MTKHSGRDVLMVQESDGWAVYLHGRQIICGESYQIASNVEWALRGGAGGTSEVDEIAARAIQTTCNHKETPHA